MGIKEGIRWMRERELINILSLIKSKVGGVAVSVKIKQ